MVMVLCSSVSDNLLSYILFMKKTITYLSIVSLSKWLETMKLWEYSKESWKLIKLLSIVQSSLSDYDKVRASILDRLWKKKEDGSYDLWKNTAKREKEYKELLETEMEVEIPFNSIDPSKIAWMKTMEVMSLYEAFWDFIVL